MSARMLSGQSWRLQVQTPLLCLDGSRLQYSSVVKTQTQKLFNEQNKQKNPTINQFRVFSHPEWAVRDVDSSPGHHDGVFHWFTWRVRTGVCAIAVIFHLDLNGVSFSILHRKYV